MRGRRADHRVRRAAARFDRCGCARNCSPWLTLKDLSAELRTRSARLDAMETGEEATSLRAALCWSYQTLSRPAARMFRLLCTRPGPAVTANVAASLAGVPVPQ